MKVVSEMTEIGETVERVDALLKETKRFQKLCDVDIERAEEVVEIGELFLLNQKAEFYQFFIAVGCFLLLQNFVVSRLNFQANN